MSEQVHTSSSRRLSLAQRFLIQNSNAIAWTLVTSAAGTGVFIAFSVLPEPYIMIDLFKIGLLPALAIITTAGAIRGPLAGLLTGYLGTLLYGLFAFGTVVTLSLNAVGFGIMGFVVGLGHYDFNNGRSLAKLSIVSSIGLLLATLVVVAIGLTVEVYAGLVAIGFVMLPLLTEGLPSVFLLTPLFAWAWLFLYSKILSRTG